MSHHKALTVNIPIHIVYSWMHKQLINAYSLFMDAQTINQCLQSIHGCTNILINAYSLFMDAQTF